MSATAQHKTRTLWLLGALHTFTHIYNVALLPLYLLIQRDLRLTGEGQTTSLVTVLMLSYFVPSYWMGILADKFSRKKLLAFGLALNGAAFVALAFAPDYAWAMAACAAAGLGGSFYHPPATAMIARLFPENTGRAFGLVGIGAGLGFCLGPLFSGWRAGMLEAALGAAAWREPVLELGLLGMAMAGLFAWLADEEKVLPTSVEKLPRAQNLFPTKMLYVFFFAAAFAFGLRDFAGAAMGSLGSLFLQKARGFSTADAGIALACLNLVSAIGNPLFGRWSDGGRKRWMTALLILSALLVAIFPHAPVRATIPLLAAYGFFFMPTFPVVEALLMQSVPDAVRGRIYGMFITIGGLVGQLAHWLAGEAVKRMGEGAHHAENYFPLYTTLAALLLLTLLGLPCLNAIARREQSAIGNPKL
jgi:MFS family permease